VCSHSAECHLPPGGGHYYLLPTVIAFAVYLPTVVHLPHFRRYYSLPLRYLTAFLHVTALFYRAWVVTIYIRLLSSYREASTYRYTPWCSPLPHRAMISPLFGLLPTPRTTTAYTVTPLLTADHTVTVMPFYHYRSTWYVTATPFVTITPPFHSTAVPFSTLPTVQHHYLPFCSHSVTHYLPPFHSWTTVTFHYCFPHRYRTACDHTFYIVPHTYRYRTLLHTTYLHGLPFLFYRYHLPPTYHFALPFLHCHYIAVRFYCSFYLRLPHIYHNYIPNILGPHFIPVLAVVYYLLRGHRSRYIDYYLFTISPTLPFDCSLPLPFYTDRCSVACPFAVPFPPVPYRPPPLHLFHT